MVRDNNDIHWGLLFRLFLGQGGGVGIVAVAMCIFKHKYVNKGRIGDFDAS